MVGLVVSQFPETVGREGRQESDAAQHTVESAMMRERLMAGVMSDDEEPRYCQAKNDGRDQLPSRRDG